MALKKERISNFLIAHCLISSRSNYITMWHKTKNNLSSIKSNQYYNIDNVNTRQKQLINQVSWKKTGKKNQLNCQGRKRVIIIQTAELLTEL